jgi:hypothetical protein
MRSRFCGQVLRKGFVPKRTVGIAAKRLYRTAQGFSPGLREREIRPESGGQGESLGHLRVIPAGVSNVGCHFQGTFHRPPDPGLKPWAVLYSRFAAKLHASLPDKTPDTCLQNRLHIRVLKCWSAGTLHNVRISLLLLPLLFCLSLSTIARAESVIILDPYFYRTPVSEAIDGSTKTVLGYYDETDGKVTPLPDPPRLTISELHTLAVAYAQSILKQTTPKIIRDRHGVIVAIRIENQDPALSSVLLTPGFTDRFENLLGKDCLAFVPNRQTVFLFPRLGSNLEQFSIPLRGIYHNSVWPVSTELFEWRGSVLHAIRDFEPN